MKDRPSQSFSTAGQFGYNGFGLPSPDITHSSGNRIGGPSSVKGEKRLKKPRDIVSISESAKEKSRELAVTENQAVAAMSPKRGDHNAIQQQGTSTGTTTPYPSPADKHRHSAALKAYSSTTD